MREENSKGSYFIVGIFYFVLLFISQKKFEEQVIVES